MHVFGNVAQANWNYLEIIVFPTNQASMELTVLDKFATTILSKLKLSGCRLGQGAKFWLRSSQPKETEPETTWTGLNKLLMAGSQVSGSLDYHSCMPSADELDLLINGTSLDKFVITTSEVTRWGHYIGQSLHSLQSLHGA